MSSEESRVPATKYFVGYDAICEYLRGLLGWAISSSTVRRYALKHGLPLRRLGDQVALTEEDALEWIAGQPLLKGGDSGVD